MESQLEIDKEINSVEVRANTIEECLADAAVQLETKVANLEYEVMEKGFQGFAGLAKKPWKLRIYENPKFMKRKKLASSVLGENQVEEEVKMVVADGKFYIRHFSNGIFIKVVLPVGGGLPVDAKDAIAAAKELLGEMDKGIWEQTIGALRKRAGVASIYPGDAAYVKDQWLRDYYTSGVEHPAELSDALLEIRRERVTEMTLEQGIRLDDLYRWSLCDLVVKRHNGEGWAGIWVTEDEAKNGFKFEGTTYTFANGGSVGETKIPITTNADRNWTLEKAGNGYYLIYNYKLEWLERNYVRPIPLNDLNLNPNLGQNYGWE